MKSLVAATCDLPQELEGSDRRVFGLIKVGEELRVHAITAADVRPGMHGDFFLVGDKTIYVFADPGVLLSCELLCAASGLGRDRVTWLPSDMLGSGDISVMTPLALLNRLGSLSDSDPGMSDKAWNLKRLAEGVLENRTRIVEESPWTMGLVLAAVQNAWGQLGLILGSEGQSFWGWALEHTQSFYSSASEDDSRRKTMSGWINAVRTFLLNEYHIDWIGQYTWGQIQAVPVSKCIRAAGMARGGLMTPRMVAGLFDETVSVMKLRHLLGQGGLFAMDPGEGERVISEMEPGEVAQAVEEAGLALAAEGWETSTFDGVTREYDTQRGVFGYWNGRGVWTDVFAVMHRDEMPVQEWVEEVVAATSVRVRRYVDA